MRGQSHLQTRVATKIVHNVFYINVLKEYHEGATPHVINFQDLEVNDNISYQERLVQILGHDITKLQNKEIPPVKHQSKHHDKNDRYGSWAVISRSCKTGRFLW